MADVLHSAVIEVGVDSRGAEIGLAKVDKAAGNTGRNLESLGGKAGSGFNAIGASSEAASKKIEAATRNQIASIQRQIAAETAGSKSTAAYQEAIARQRGINVDALRPYLKQLDDVRAKQEAAAKAAAKNSAAVEQLEGATKRAGASVSGFAKSLILGAAVGLSIGAVTAKIMGVIDSMAKLKTLSEKTGSSVENLSKLGFAAKQSGSDIDSVAAALAKLSKGMAGADADSKGAGLALKFLGLSAKDAVGNLKDPAALFTEIAKKLALYEDGAGKVALAQALLGKSGADMLPTLKLIAEQGDIAAKVTDAQATAARQYTRDMAKLDAQKGLLFKTIAVSLLPTMTDFAGVLLDASKKTNQLNSAAKGLSEDNSIADWADTGAMGLARLLDVIVFIPKALSAVSSSFKVAGADLNFLYEAGVLANPVELAKRFVKGGNPSAKLNDAAEARDKVKAEADAKYVDLWNYDGAAMEKAMAARIAKRVTAKASDVVKPTLLKANFDTSGENGDTKAQAAIKKEADAYATLISAIKEKTEANKLDLATGIGATESQKATIKLDQQLASGKLKLSDSHIAAARAALQEQAASESLLKARDTERDVANAIAASTLVRQDSAAQLAIEYELYGKSNDAREIAMIAVREQTSLEKFLLQAKKDGKVLTEDQIARLKEEASARTSVESATMAQTKALNYAAQLTTENKRFSAESIIDAKDRAAAILRVDDAMWQERIALAGAGTDAQRQLQEAYTTWYQNQLDKPRIDELKKAVDTYSDVFRTGFADMLNNGKAGWSSFTKSLVTTFKTSVADQLYKMFAQPFVVRMVASLMGVTGGTASTLVQAATGAPGASSGVGSYVSAAQTAKSAYEAISSGFAGLSTTVADTVQGVMYQSGMTTQIASNGAFASGAGAVASAAAGLVGGHYLGNAISGQYGIGDHGQAVVNTGAAVGAVIGSIIPVLGTALGAIIGGALGGLANRVFGMGDEKVTGNTLNGSFGANGFAGNTDTKIHQDGGFFRSDKDFTRSTAIDSPTANALSAAYDQIKAASADFATTLGINADSIKDRAQALSIALTDDKAANQKAISDFFIGVGDSIATELLPNISSFTKAATEFGGATESASATLQRISTDYAFVDVALSSINATFGAVGVGSITARERLLDLTGGLDAFGKGVASFSTNYLTEAEKLAPVAKTVSAGFASLGLAVPETRGQFKALVLGLDLTTESGATTYAGLIKVQDGFAQLHPAIEAVADALAATNKTYQDQIDEILKSSMSAADVRAMETKGMNASTVALYDRLAALKGEASANVTAAEAITKARDAAAASAKASSEAFSSFANAVAGTMKSTTEAAAALRGYNDALLVGSNSPLDLQGRRDEAARQFAKSPGDTAASNAFIEAAKALRDAGGTGLAYARDVAQVRASISAAASAKDAHAAAIPDFLRSIRDMGIFGNEPATVSTVPAQIYSANQAVQPGSADMVSRAEFQQVQANLAAALNKIATNTGAAADSLEGITTGRHVVTTEALT
jgi:hypothetical protein